MKLLFIVLTIILIIVYLLVRNPIYEYLPFNLIKKPSFPIDVVYTWAGENKELNVRTAYNYELKYSIISILKYLPWVNHIYVLMNPFFKTWCKTIQVVPSSLKGGRTHSLVLDINQYYSISVPHFLKHIQDCL